MEPLNSDDVVFSLNFINNFEGIFVIDEPLNFDGLNFVLQQDDGRYGRDVSFAGGEFDLRFDKKSNQNASQLPLLLFYNTEFGFESQVQFIITIYGVDYVIGLLDYQRAITDGLTYFEASVIQESPQALLKRRSDIKIDMFSAVDLDGNAIVPLSTDTLFLPGKSTTQTSQWFATNSTTDSFFGNITWNHINAVQQSEIQDTLSFAVLFNADPEFLRYIEAENDIFDVVLSIDDFTLTQTDQSFTELVFRIGVDFSVATETTLFDFSNGDFVDFSDTFDLPDIARGQTLWVYFRSMGVGTTSFTAAVGATIEITVNASPISTVTPAINIQDIIRHIILSTSGMATEFSDDFILATEDEFCFNGLALRGFDPDNFYISFDDVLKGIKEINPDYQIVNSTLVFVGLYADFYPDFEVGNNTVAPNADFKITYNPRYTINKFSFEYDKFEDNKNSENNDALSGIHTQSQWNLPNTQVEFKKEIDIGFIRDAFLLEAVRLFNSQSKNETSTKNDQDTFIVDINPIPISVINSYNFNSFVSVDTVTELITFTNNNSFSFIATGLGLGDIVDFDANNGEFTATGTVTSISASIITINDFGLSGIINAQYLVNFSFTILALIARTNDGFTAITNDGANGAGFLNILYSPKRNILNYWGSYLNTSCSFSQTGTIQNTFYVNNPDLTSFILADGLGLLREGDDILVSALNTRLLTPFIVETTIIMEFTEFQDIVLLLREERGYLTIADNNGNELQVYPQLLDYDWEINSLRVIGEQRI